MKKNQLAMGIIFILVGVGFFVAAIFTHNELDSLFCGLSGGGIGSGALILYRYFYAKAHGHEKEYQEKQEQEEIELHDELKEKLRNQSGRYAYIVGIVVAALAYLVFSALSALHIIESSSAILFFLAFFVLFQLLAGHFIFKYLLKKYE